jgi:hypothetical protein
MTDSPRPYGRWVRRARPWLAALLAASMTAPFLANAQPTPPAPATEPGSEPAEAGPEPLASSAPLSGPSKPRFFYFGQDYGSESQFGPLNVFVNVGFSVVGKAGGFHIVSPFDVNYPSSAKELWNSYVHPERIPHGYGDYFSYAVIEWFPAFVPSWPNYALHIMGEGMLSRKLYEYNLAQGMSPGWARFQAIATLVLAQQMNELLEAKTVPVGDAISDTVINNTLGIILFSYDGVARLFSNEYLRLYYWPGQALVDVRDGAMYNNSETYVLRSTLGGWTRAKVNLMLGVPSQGIGLSYPVGGEDSIGAVVLNQVPLVPAYPYARGPQLAKVRYVPATPSGTDPVTTADATQTAVRFTWDRGGSLLATLEFGFPVRPNVVANVYPGFVRAGPVQFGAYLYADASIRAVALTVSNLAVMPAMRL